MPSYPPIERIAADPNQESVWDYPRPPRLEQQAGEVRVEFAGAIVARSRHAWRVLETSHPPTIYIPAADVDMACLREAGGGASLCEWKGVAAYFDLCRGPRVARRAAWTYRSPTAPYAALANCIAFYPSRVDACYIDDERVGAQAGEFYGGWITSKVVGPFKGVPGSGGW